MTLIGKTALDKMTHLRQRVDKISKLVPLSHRLSPSVEIIAVSKGQNKEKILPLLRGGHCVFGENRVQEAQQKWISLKSDFPCVKLHMIGALQSNKIDDALALFDEIHTLDRLKLAGELKKRFDKGVKLPDLFIQINIGAEPQKSGIAIDEADDFIIQCQKMNLPIKGLMGLPPRHHNPSAHFALLHVLAQKHRLTALSIGMSADYEAAILSGATHIRCGRLIFGARA